MKQHPAIQSFAQHVNPTFVKLLGMWNYGRVYTHAKGVWLYDHENNCYLDFLAGFGSINAGHNHPRFSEAAQRFFASSPVSLCHMGISIHEAELGARLAKLAPPLTMSLFASSGAEAAEAGIKLARASTRRHGILYCTGSYHGTTLGTLSIMGSQRMRAPFEPLLSDCQPIPFGELSALEDALKSKKIAAFITEPIQAEGGMNFPPASYLSKAAELCRHYGTLFILDEIQTGLGRTGVMLACLQAGTTPDVLLLAKALGGGIAPVSVALTTSKIHRKAYGSMDRFDLHSSTFGGNAFSCAMAQELLSIIEDEDLVSNSATRGKQLLQGLQQRLSGHPFIRDIRGQGLLVAIELGPTDKGWVNKIAPSLVSRLSRELFGQWAALRLLEAGMICQPCAHQWNVLKLEPPLTITQKEIELGIEMIASVFEAYPRLMPLLKDILLRTGQQATQGWKIQ